MIRCISIVGTLLVGGALWGCSQEVTSGQTGQSQSGVVETDQDASSDAPPATPPGPPEGCISGDAPPPPQQGPPPEAFDACKSLAEGAACSVSFHDKTLAGSCRKGPFAGAPLACAPTNMSPPPAPRQGPPPAAFDACKSLAEGAACSVHFHDKTLAGSCRKGPFAGAPLACAPTNMPPPAPPPAHCGPPPEAFDACTSLAEGAACSVTLHDKTLDGSCRKGPFPNAPLACAPANMLPTPPKN